MKLLDELRAVNVDRLDLDDAVALLTFGQSLEGTYKSKDLEVPQFLKDSVDVLNKEVTRRRRDNLEAALRGAIARRESLRTSEEKRRDTEAEIARLQSALGVEKAQAAPGV